MEGRTVGSSRLCVLDSDQTGLTLSPAPLLKVGIAHVESSGETAGGAVFAHIPGAMAGQARGALFALATSETAAVDGQPAAALALRQLYRSYYTSLCHESGRALASALHSAQEHMRRLAWCGHDLAECMLAAAAVQDYRLCMVTTGPCVALVLRPGRSEWRALAAAPPDGALHSLPLESGDLVLLGSPGLANRVSTSLIRSCCSALLGNNPNLAPQILADVLIRFAEGRPGTGVPSAIVVRCDPWPAGAPAAPGQSIGRPAAFPWNFGDLHKPAQVGPSAPPAGIDRAPSLRAANAPVPVPAYPSGIDRAPSLRAANALLPMPAPPVGSAHAPSLPAAPIPADPPAPRAMVPARPVAVPREPAASTPPAGLTAIYENMAAALPTWISAERRIVQTLAPGSTVLVGGGLMGAWLSGDARVAVVGCSLGGLLFWAGTRPPAPPAARPLLRPQPVMPRPRPPAPGTKGVAAEAAGSAGQARTRLLNALRPEEAGSLAPPARPGGAVALHWTRDRLLLPPPTAVAAGCLDIVSLKDRPGHIVAQLVLLCPGYLLSGNGGYPGGVYVLLHDLETNQQRLAAWLAPGRRQLQAPNDDVLVAGRPPAVVRWLRGQPEFELASSRLRATLQIDSYRFADPLRKQQLESLEVRLTHVEVVS